MKQSLYFKNFISTALIVLSSFILLGGLALTWSYRRALNENQAAMQRAANEAARYIGARSLNEDFDLSGLDIGMWLTMVSGVSGFELLLTCDEGIILSCSDRRFTHLGMGIPPDYIPQVRNAVRFSTLGGIYTRPRHVVGAPMTRAVGGEREVFGYLFLSSDIEAFRADWMDFSVVFTLISLGVMALSAIITFIFTKKLAGPINEMAVAAGRFARGDFSTRVKDLCRQDEVGQLTVAFNAMADSMESQERLRREFIANVSHELKTPMTVIAGFADGILDGTIEDSGKYLGVISSETRRLSRLVNSMLDLSKLQASDEVLKMSFDIAEVTRLALLSLSGKIDDRGLDVTANLPEEPIKTRGDRDSITQVVYNLIDNAIKFSRPGGTIVIELWKQGGKAFVSVENQGETIPEDELAHIFTRFHKADKSRSADREGVGLGLYICKSILDNHNEDIFVSSKDGVTKFVFSLTLV
ncbi:MAG: HAMP domain-containing histidine kinase [Oscillospiraceae bacterium]|nr:HAMP domain-containing histidine kinase [Oscillospiraceae bacterium]